MRRRLRDAPDVLKDLYPHPYDHTRWDEHVQRVDWTIQHGVSYVSGAFGDSQEISIIDLACGDGAISLGIAERLGVDRRFVTLGDLVLRDDALLDLTGPIEETTLSLRMPNAFRWNVMVLSETIEHLDDPDAVLRTSREVAEQLLLTTPLTEKGHDNDEHLWEWDLVGVEEMLHGAGFEPLANHILELPWYDYQLWWCK